MAGETMPDGTPVRWLTEEQQRSWRAFREGSARLMEILGRQLDEEAHLSMGEYEVLVRLSEADDRTMRMSELAHQVTNSRSRLTHTVSRMEQAGLVTRVACESDARGVNCMLTDRGVDALVAAAPGHVHAVRDSFVDLLTEEQLSALGSAMAVIAAALEPAPRRPAPARA
jgi:DNA-binding MarR family transcriptional regulator